MMSLGTSWNTTTVHKVLLTWLHISLDVGVTRVNVCLLGEGGILVSFWVLLDRGYFGEPHGVIRNPIELNSSS